MHIQHVCNKAILPIQKSVHQVGWWLARFNGISEYIVYILSKTVNTMKWNWKNSFKTVSFRCADNLTAKFSQKRESWKYYILKAESMYILELGENFLATY